MSREPPGAFNTFSQRACPRRAGASPTATLFAMRYLALILIVALACTRCDALARRLPGARARGWAPMRRCGTGLCASPEDADGDRAEVKKKLDFLLAKQSENRLAEVANDSPERREKRMEEWARTKAKYLGDQVFVAALIGSGFWAFGTVQDFWSYALGAFGGILYFRYLSRYVDTIGSAGMEGSGGSERFAIVILLVLFPGKFPQVLHFVPLLAGFLTYQVSALAQAFDIGEDDDDLLLLSQDQIDSY